MKNVFKGAKKNQNKPAWNNSVNIDKSLSFTDRSFRGDKSKNNITMTEEDEEDMKEVMKMMND